MHDSDIVCEVIKHLIKAKPDLGKRGKNKDLFEVLFKPTKFGNEYKSERDKRKKKIQKLLLISVNLQERTTTEQDILTKFNELANNIPNDLKEEDYRTNTLNKFVFEQFENLKIKYDLSSVTVALNNLLSLEKKPTKNYSTQFSNWKKPGNPIEDDGLKSLLTNNFGLDDDIWTTTNNENFNRIKTIIQKNVKNSLKDAFTKSNPDGVYPYTKNLFDEINSKHKLQYITTDAEELQLKKLRTMNHKDTMKFLHSNYNNSLSQALTLKMIPIFFDKGFYELVLDDGIEALDLVLRNDTTIKKIRAHALGSAEVAKYDEAYEILSSINSNNDKEIIDLQTSAISNMRRFQLTDKNIKKEKLKQLLKTIICYYQVAFNYNETYHYYPGVNLTYMMYIENSIFNTNYDIKKISEQSANSIKIDQDSPDLAKRYYANISHLELLLLNNSYGFIEDLDEYIFELDLTTDTDKCLYIPMLERTVRQLKLLIELLNPYINKKNTLYINVEKAFKIINKKISSNPIR